MRKKLLSFTAIAAMLFFVGCSNEELVPDVNPETVRTLSLTATMPDENKQPAVSAFGDDKPTTRVALEEEGKDITLTWQVDDEIQFAFSQGGESALEVGTVTSISNDGKKANFEIPIPVGITGEFQLYGVYGLEGITINPNDGAPYVVLSNSSGNAGTLAQVEEREDVMLFFETTIESDATDISVNFNHLGSLFSITINNITASVGQYLQDNGINEFRLAGVDTDNENWAYFSRENDITTGFNLNTKDFYELQNARNYIYFNPAAQGNSVINEVITLWAWYPILPGQVWPDLQLQLGAGEVFDISSTNNKSAKTPITGKRYSFYATFNADNTISFTDKDFNILP